MEEVPAYVVATGCRSVRNRSNLYSTRAPALTNRCSQRIIPNHRPDNTGKSIAATMCLHLAFVPGQSLHEHLASHWQIWSYSQPRGFSLLSAVEDRLETHLASDAHEGPEYTSPFCSTARAFVHSTKDEAPETRSFLVQFSFEGFVDSEDSSVAIGTVFLAFSAGKKPVKFDDVQRMWTAVAPYHNEEHWAELDPEPASDRWSLRDVATTERFMHAAEYCGGDEETEEEDAGDRDDIDRVDVLSAVAGLKALGGWGGSGGGGVSVPMDGVDELDS